MDVLYPPFSHLLLIDDLLPVILQYLPLRERYMWVHECSKSLRTQIQRANHGVGPNSVSMLPTGVQVCVTKTGGLSQLDILVHNMLDKLLPKRLYIDSSSLATAEHCDQNLNKAKIDSAAFTISSAAKKSSTNTTVSQHNTVFDLHVHRNYLCTPKEYHVSYPVRSGPCPTADFQICVVGETCSDFLHTLKHYATRTQHWFIPNCVFVNLCECEEMSQLLSDFCCSNQHFYVRMNRHMSLIQMEHVLKRVVYQGVRNDTVDLRIPSLMIDKFIHSSKTYSPMNHHVCRPFFTDQLFEFIARELVHSNCALRNVFAEMISGQTNALSSNEFTFRAMYHEKKFDLAKILSKIGWSYWSPELQMAMIKRIANDILFVSESKHIVHAQVPHVRLLEAISRNELEYHEPIYQKSEDCISVRWWCFQSDALPSSSSNRQVWNRYTIFKYEVTFPLRPPFTMTGDYQPRTLHEFSGKKESKCKIM